ncbi:hypothetical protein BG011_001926 [Mortierella polycephala]|uniref:UBA domain-containing protein n=1 Tax=Mortierella polycephala TaxID=41804 RepID=A0A9P6Q4D3_9FUNG|nr:hypothetical protein BG011_001926 [Mortierella polycephala]
MDDLIGLSWDQKGSSNANTSSFNNLSNSAGAKIKHPPPPPTAKPAHLQMGLSKTGITPTTAPAPTNSFSNNVNGLGNGRGNGIGIGNGNGNGNDSFAGLSKPFTIPSSQPTPTLSSLAAPIPRFPPSLQQQQKFQGMALNTSRNQSPVSFLASPGSMGRSLSPAMTSLQPERSKSSSPATDSSTPTPPKDPFDALLGDKISRSSSSVKNQSLNSMRYNTPPPAQPTPKGIDPWDLDFLANMNAAKASQPAPSTNNGDVFDLGSFEKALPQQKRVSVDALNSFIGKQPTPSITPSTFKPSPPISKPPRSSPPQSSSSPKVSSHQDGDIAQIVSMGFSAERAKLALSMTENGRDIEAAIEYLIQNDEAEDQLPSRRRTPMTGSTGSGVRGKVLEERRPYRDNDDSPLEDRRRRNQGRTQGQEQRQQELTAARQLQQQKDKIVGTASIFGMSVLSKANEIYKQGREKVQSVMEDMSTEETRSSPVRRHEWIEDKYKPSTGGYKDSDSEDEVYKGRRQQQTQQRQYQQERQQPSAATRPRQDKENFENTYVSSSRRGAASARSQPLFSMDDSNNTSKSNLSGLSSASRGASSTTASSTISSSRSTRAPSPLPPKKPTRPSRVLVQAGSQQLLQSNHFKEKGNEVFKLGQFGQAAEFYARASQSLPSGHLLLIVTQNNRAAALLKIGEYRETVTECERSILLVQGPDGQGVNDVLPADAGVNLKDQLGKAFMRRATAYEHLEKYKEAKDDWARLRELEPSHRNAVEGHRRCEKAMAMANGTVPSGSGSVASRKPAASPTVNRSTSSPMQDIFASHQKINNEARIKADLERSEGVTKLRQSAAQQEQEDDEKLRLSDQVERKMTMWKTGKEDNVRALIASLGSVLWEGIGWKPVGMHELVTPAQVKIKYMRAIGKMHPDKLGASTTVEQRMMANTIFSTLNSAWDAFKAQNNM